MKAYSKIFAAVALTSLMAACAEQDVDSYYVEKPSTLDEVEALNSYGNIKDYVDRAQYPNFKIACALGANDYNDRGIVYRVANSNFDEITLGNAMKYASVVGDDGEMNFQTITDLLDNAEQAGMSVYGHTLAWHAQQNVTWLNSLIADEIIEIKPEDFIEDVKVDFADYTEFPFELIKKFQPEIVDGAVTVSGKNKQFYVTPEFATEKGKEYEIKMFACSSKEQSFVLQFGDKTNKVKIPMSTEWREYSITGPAVGETSYVLFDTGLNEVSVEIAWVKVGHYPPGSRELTDEEKVANLTAEADRWVSGMMKACGGRVKAWDLVNEAIGGDGDVNGYYDLQHGSEDNKTDFFWQDYLGSENYVPVFEAAARKAFKENGGNPEDLKLFVNDYNLESFWDNNKKLESLCYWVDVWTKKGAKIDGVSSQMHISYSENKEFQQTRADHVVKMLHRMAATGLLVRISELDMGYQDITATSMFDNGLRTEQLNAEQLQNMANYYRFIIQMYLKIVPKDQQYSICQWCLTDAPSDSGWRGGEPVGLWTLDWQRKAAYVAYCEALSTPIPDTEDYFEYLDKCGLTHYISTPAE